MTRGHPALVLGLALCACTGGSETGNPSVPASLTLAAHTSARSAVDLSPATDGVFIEEAWVSFGEIEFELATACDLETEDELELPAMAVDLARGAENVATIELPTEAYCRLEVPMDGAELPLPAGAPASLEGRSFVLLGRTALGRPFEVASTRGFELEVRSDATPFTVTVATRRMVLSLDAARWLASVELDAATVDADGVVRVNDDTNPDALRAIEDGLEASLELAVDRNGNGLWDATDLPIGVP